MKARYHVADSHRQRIGPFPGNLDDATFMSFIYEAIDVLCLEELSITQNGDKILVLQVWMRFIYITLNQGTWLTARSSSIISYS